MHTKCIGNEFESAHESIHEGMCNLNGHRYHSIAQNQTRVAVDLLNHVTLGTIHASQFKSMQYCLSGRSSQLPVNIDRT